MKYFSALLGALIALLCPIAPLIIAATTFILVDFVTGVIASRAEARRNGSAWWFESRKAWRTIFKAGFVAVAIVMTWIIDHYMLDFLSLNLANLFAGFVCGIELWSFLENAATISNAPIFEWLGRWVKRRIGEEVSDESRN